MDERLPPPPVEPYELNHELHPSKQHTVQINKKAVGSPSKHRVEWSYLGASGSGGSDPNASGLRETGTITPAAGAKFVRALRLGDVVTLWAHARFGSWRNKVHSARVDIYWAI
jgi:hypothetical protein